MAICLLGQQRSIELTAPNIREHLLDYWDADAFVHSHSDDGDDGKSAASAASRLHQLLGPRVVSLTMSDGVDADVASSAAAFALWRVYGSPLAQYEARAGCQGQIVQHTRARRQTAYKYFARMRLDMLLLQPVPLAFLDRLKTNCTAIVPAGEDYGGLNDRMLFGDSCAFAMDAGIMGAVARLDGRHIAEGWNPERANAHNLATLGGGLERPPLAACLLTVEGACKLRGELVQSEALLPNLLTEKPHLCGSLLTAANADPCDPTRFVIADDAMRARDPGFCALEKRFAL